MKISLTWWRNCQDRPPGRLPSTSCWDAPDLLDWKTYFSSFLPVGCLCKHSEFVFLILEQALVDHSLWQRHTLSSFLLLKRRCSELSLARS